MSSGNISCFVAHISKEPQDEAKLHICPKKRLESLDHLRLESTALELRGDGLSESGGQGTVVLGIFRPNHIPDPNTGQTNSRYVAVKKLRLGNKETEDQFLAQFAYEVQLLNDLSHQNIVKLLGFVQHVTRDIAWLVFDWQVMGNLQSFIKSSKDELGFLERTSLIHDVATGLAYLHEQKPPIRHGDLKSMNILISEKYRAIITDFGSARRVHATCEELASVEQPLQENVPEPTLSPNSPRIESGIDVNSSSNYITLTGAQGTLQWTAPEVLMRNERPCLPSDVWAFGWVCWEVITGKLPFQEGEEAVGLFQISMRMDSEDLPVLGQMVWFVELETLCNQMTQCWGLNPITRPSARQCRDSLAELPKMTPSLGKPKLDSGTLFTMGKSCAARGKREEAIRHLRAAVEMASLAGSDVDTARALMALGSQYTSLQANAEARRFYTKATYIFEKLGDRHGQAESLMYSGLASANRSCSEQCIKPISEAYNICKEIGDPVLLGPMSVLMAVIWLRKRDFQRAVEVLYRALNSFSTLGRMAEVESLAEALGQILWGARRIRPETYFDILHQTTGSYGLWPSLDPIEDRIMAALHGIDGLGLREDSQSWPDPFSLRMKNKLVDAFQRDVVSLSTCWKGRMQRASIWAYRKISTILTLEINQALPGNRRGNETGSDDTGVQLDLDFLDSRHFYILPSLPLDILGE